MLLSGLRWPTKIALDPGYIRHWTYDNSTHIIMASALSLGLGLLGAGLAGRVAFQMLRAGKGGAEQFVKGGFKGKMDKAEAMQILGLR